LAFLILLSHFSGSSGVKRLRSCASRELGDWDYATGLVGGVYLNAMAAIVNPRPNHGPLYRFWCCSKFVLIAKFYY